MRRCVSLQDASRGRCAEMLFSGKESGTQAARYPARACNRFARHVPSLCVNLLSLLIEIEREHYKPAVAQLVELT